MRHVISSLLIAAAACGSSKPQPAAQPPAPPVAPVHEAPVADEAPPAAPEKPIANTTLAAIGLDPDALDRTADPCEDFYQFACGGWIAKTEIPADKSEAMRSFVAIDDHNTEFSHTALEAARSKPGDDNLLQSLGAFYGSCMDETAIAKAGIRPVKPLLDTIAGVKDAKSLTRVLAAMHAQGLSPVFVLGPSQDAADARKVIADIEQGGLGLPDRDYYLKLDDGKNKELVAAYEKLVASLLVTAGHKPDAAAQEATAVVALETELAKVSKDKVARRDPKTMYNKMDRAGVAKLAPRLDWPAFWKTVGLANNDEITVGSPDFLTGVDALAQATKPAVWRAYLTAYALRANAPYLTKEIEQTVFEYRALFTGQKEQQPRWRRCTMHTDEALGDLLGQVFVRDRFGGASKAASEDEVQAIVAAMKQNLDALPWMDATTKARAKQKLASMTYQIGYPKKWRSYAFKIDPKAWAANAMAADRAELARQLAKIGKPVDKDDWGMTPVTVNAYYDPQLNTMVFPAGILQPPFYSVDASIPVNFGAIGIVMGHELTHGFDDEGAQFDGDGNLKDWWQPATAAQFKQRTQCVVNQYGQYVTEGTKLNGANTAGENIADIGGTKLALTAYRAMRASAKDTAVADGFTEDQQFFLSFGQAWCAKETPARALTLAKNNVHSPPQWRINGALSANPEFAKAFRCKLGSKMRPTNACVVW